MSGLASGLRAYALLDASIVAEIADRFYDKRVPQRAPLPYVVARRVSSQPNGHLGGGATTFADRWQLEAYAETGAGCERLTELLRVRFDGARGKFGAVDVGACLLLNEVDDNEPLEDGSEAAVHRTIQDYEVWHQR